MSDEQEQKQPSEESEELQCGEAIGEGFYDAMEELKSKRDKIEKKQPQTINRICPECNKVSQHSINRYNDLDEQINCGKCGNRNPLYEWGNEEQSSGNLDVCVLKCGKPMGHKDFCKECDYRKQPNMNDIQRYESIDRYPGLQTSKNGGWITVEDYNAKLDGIVAKLQKQIDKLEFVDNDGTTLQILKEQKRLIEQCLRIEN